MRNEMAFKKRNGCMMILALFFVMFFLFADIGVNVAWGVMVLTVLLVLEIIFHRRRYLFNISNGYLALLITVITVLANMRSFSFLQSNPFYIFAMLLALILGACIESDISSRQTVLKILFIGAFVVAAIPIISRLFPSVYINHIVPLLSHESQIYVSGLLSQGYSGVVGAYISLTANYIVIGYAISVARLLASRKKRNWIFILYFLLSLILINRRAEVLACFVATVVLLYLCLSKRARFIMSAILLFSISSLAIWIIGVKIGAWRYDGDNRLLRMIVNLVSNNDVSNGRFALYGVAWDLFCEHPIFGVGFGEFRRYGSLIIPNITNVHNIYLQLLCEIGIVGTIVVLSTSGYLLHKAYGAFCSERKGIDFSSKFFALFMIVYIMILGLFDNPIFQDTFWILLCLIIFCAHKGKLSIKEKKCL